MASKISHKGASVATEEAIYQSCITFTDVEVTWDAIKWPQFLLMCSERFVARGKKKKKKSQDFSFNWVKQMSYS